MLQLYHFWDSFCSFKVRLCLEEKGLPWQGTYVDLMAFENVRPDYLRINPAGLVPVLIHDGETVTESSIINEYLDDRFPAIRLRPADALELARMRLWVRHEEDELFIAVRPASLNLMMKKVFARYSEQQLDELLAHHPRPDRVSQLKQMFHAPFDAKAVDSSRRMLSRAFARMNASLGKRPWLAGDTYSLADIAAAPVVDRVERLGMAELWNDLPAFADWVKRLTGRSAYRRAMPRDEYRMPGAQA